MNSLREVSAFLWWYGARARANADIVRPQFRDARASKREHGGHSSTPAQTNCQFPFNTTTPFRIRLARGSMGTHPAAAPCADPASSEGVIAGLSFENSPEPPRWNRILLLPLP